MAYLGTPPKSRVLSSADIATGAVTLDDISFTDQPTSVNVSGNIDKHTMRLSDEVVIDGDLNITDNLILSKISDDGNAITLTTDGSTRTIEGTGGSLEASTLTQTPNASLTGMTGTVGSGVTIGSDVTFPAGHVIQTVADSITTAADSDTTSSNSLVLVERGSNIYDWKKTITGVTSGNWVVVEMNFMFFMSRSSTDLVGSGYGIFHSTADDGSGTSTIYETSGDGFYIHIGSATNTTWQQMAVAHLLYVHKSPSAGSNTYYLGQKVYASSGSPATRIHSSSGKTPFVIKLTEVQA